jgi:hypothetical protein
MQPKLPSERAFGFTMSGVAFLVGSYALYRGWNSRLVAVPLILGGILAAASVLAPRILAIPNRAWYQLGLILSKIVNPVVMGVLFFGLLTPIAMLMRRFGRDELRLKRPAADSYWIERTPHGPASDSFTNQF